MTEKVNTWIEKFKNPAIWIAMISFFFWISVKLYKVDVIEDRQTKWIGRTNDLHEDIDAFKFETIERLHEVELSVKEEEIKRLKERIETLKGE